jgi:hypothetical protein
LAPGGSVPKNVGAAVGAALAAVIAPHVAARARHVAAARITLVTLCRACG